MAWPSGQAARGRHLPDPARHGRARRDDHRRPRRAPGRNRPRHGPTAAPLHAAPHTPPKFGEICANKRSRVYVVWGMITPADQLPDDLETAHQLIRELLETLGQQIHLNAKLQHQLEQLLRHRYGRKSERVDPAQLLLFAQKTLPRPEPKPAPDPDPAPAPDPTPPASAPRRKKKAHARKPLPASLLRKPVLHDVPPEQLPCP